MSECTELEKARYHLAGARRQEARDRADLDKAITKYGESCALVGRLEDWVEGLEREEASNG